MARDPQSDTASVTSEMLSVVTVRGRDHQQYAIDNGIYFVPIDEDEDQRLSLQHRVIFEALDQRLIVPDIPYPEKILDCGYGNAAWAVEVAETYPDCEVIGVDISPHLKPDDTPENLWLQLDDLNQAFTFERNTFDFVHSQLVSGGINKRRWPGYLRDIYRVLKPGGWAQLSEMYLQSQSYNGVMTDDNALRKWSDKLHRSLDDVKNLRVANELFRLMTDAGFTRISVPLMVPLPMCGWQQDPKLGRMNEENVHNLLGSLSSYPLRERLGMSDREWEDLITQAQVEASDPSLKPYFAFYYCFGQKPL